MLGKEGKVLESLNTATKTFPKQIGKVLSNEGKIVETRPGVMSLTNAMRTVDKTP